MIPLVSTRSVSELFAFLAPYAKRAASQERIAEYRDHGQADLEYPTRLNFEIMLAQHERIERLEARVAELETILKPE